jgi:predicted secreted Zn-dependent protease
VLRRWRTYIARLAAHEDGHVSFAWRAMPALVSTLRRSSCARANADAELVLNRIRKHDIDFDRATDHGRRQGVRFP